MARYGFSFCLPLARSAAALCALLGASSLARATQPAAPAIMPEQISTLRGVGDVALAPDGRHIVYGVRAFADPARPPVTRLWFQPVAPDAHAVRLEGSQDNDSHPRWSPDGRHLAYIGRHGGAHDTIWLAGPAGEAPRDLGPFAGDAIDFRWSPDGGRLAVLVRPVPPSAPVARVDGSAPDDMPPGPGLVILTVADGHIQPVALDAHAVFDVEWAPDGQSLAVRAGRSDGLDAFWYQSAISIIDTAGHVLHRLPGRATAVHPVFSPDGGHLAWGHFDQDGIVGTVSRYDLADGRAHKIGAGWSGSVRAMAWNADGRSLTVLGFHDIAPCLGRMDAANGTISQTVDLGGEPYAFSMARDGTVALPASTPTRAEDVWIVQDGHGRALTDLNPQVSGWPLGAQRVVRWQGRDGTALSGLLVLPPGQSRDVPLFTQIHGGPYDAWAQGWLGSWHDWARMLASHGIAVFMPNPRGSDGRGAAFAEATRGDWGGADARDILDGIDMLTRQGVADPRRLALGGWSYGGFMAAWMAGHEKRFLTVIDGAGITDLRTMALSTDVGPGFLPPYFGDPVDRATEYAAHSPINAANLTRMPILLLHGMSDARVPPEQAMIFFNSLKAQGTRVELVRYPDAPHWFGGAVGAMVEEDVQRRVLTWLTPILRPAP
ncbi:S9 family peptidase [Gluconacetobacter aggeris]|uniref:S9 family peptidase n=1 Tax=Gluconacetobacter aggeris TaxID=1286186 RepID=A0A7W4IQH6_9PROT|nr:S9 family peptidase [Gluconacetobacter aggeris]MBB2166937.1 S9 family peptidase [Gluconacetobacter aggeris]